MSFCGRAQTAGSGDGAAHLDCKRAWVYAIALLAIFAWPTAISAASYFDEKTGKRAMAVSKDIYENLQHFSRLMKEDMQRLGIDARDIDPRNLPFDSSSLSECASHGLPGEMSAEDRIVVVIACLKRHADASMLDHYQFLEAAYGRAPAGAGRESDEP